MCYNNSGIDDVLQNIIDKSIENQWSRSNETIETVIESLEKHCIDDNRFETRNIFCVDII